jgi:hypothetical protein
MQFFLLGCISTASYSNSNVTLFNMEIFTDLRSDSIPVVVIIDCLNILVNQSKPLNIFFNACFYLNNSINQFTGILQGSILGSSIFYIFIVNNTGVCSNCFFTSAESFLENIIRFYFIGVFPDFLDTLYIVALQAI